MCRQSLNLGTESCVRTDRGAIAYFFYSARFFFPERERLPETLEAGVFGKKKSGQESPEKYVCVRLFFLFTCFIVCRETQALKTRSRSTPLPLHRIQPMYGPNPQSRNVWAQKRQSLIATPPTPKLQPLHSYGSTGQAASTYVHTTGSWQLSLRSSYKHATTLPCYDRREPSGEAYEALVSFLDEAVPSWRAYLARDMVKAVRGDGEVRKPIESYIMLLVDCWW